MEEAYLFAMNSKAGPAVADSGNPYEDGEFLWYDWVIFTLTLLVSLSIGVVFACSGQNSTKEYLMGNRSFSTLPVAISMFMSYISAILVLGNTAEMYQHGIMQWFAMIGSCLAYFLSGLIFVPLFFPLGVTSSFEYLQMRFKSRSVKLSGTILLMISQTMYMGTAMYSPATALESVTPIPEWAAILATGVVATIYTSIGGMKAVIWSDVFQGVIYIGGLIVVLILGAIEVGGISEAFKIASEKGRTEIEWTLNPAVRMSFWSVVVGRTISSLQTTGTGQTSVQRYCALPTLKAAVWSVWTNIPFMLFAYSLTCIIGIIVFAYYEQIGCDPIQSGQISSGNQLLPFFIVNGLGVPALPGLFVAVLFSGALSSVSSSMNSLAAVTWKDILEIKFYYLKEERKALITKILAALFGVLAVGFAFFVGTLGGNVLQISQSFVSGTAGPLLGVFVLGAFFPWSNWIGALFGSWLGLIINMGIILGESFTEPYRSTLNTTIEFCNDTFPDNPIEENPDDVFFLFRMSFMWFSAFGALTCVLIGMLVSCCTGLEDPEDQDPLLIVPLFDRMFCCLPKSLRRKLQCKIPFDEVELDEGGHAVKFIQREEDEEDEDKAHEMEDGLGFELDVKEPRENDTANGLPAYEEIIIDSKDKLQIETGSTGNFDDGKDEGSMSGKRPPDREVEEAPQVKDQHREALENGEVFSFMNPTFEPDEAGKFDTHL